MWSCGRDFCPHIHDKYCLNGRLKDYIPYTIFPIRTIDSFTNVHIRCTNRYKSNVPTVAYENREQSKDQSVEDDRNFVKDYYLQNCPDTAEGGLCNNIERDLREQMATRSAYVLADNENIKYQEESRKRKLFLDNARHRAVSRYNDFFQRQAHQKQQDMDDNAKWLQKLYRKLQEVAKHIIQGEGQSLGQREKNFLLSKANLTPSYLSQIKIKNPKVACQLLQELRILMMKKKLRFQNQRQEQQHNKSVSVSFASQQNSQNTSQGSMMSEATSAAGSKAEGSAQVVEKYCDFEALKKKWKLQDIEEVKQMLRRILTREIVSHAQLQAVKKRRQAQKNNQIILSTRKSPLKTVSQAKRGRTASKKDKQASKKKDTGPPKAAYKQELTKEQKLAKESLIQGGQFDALGQRYERNRNFNEIFKRKQEEMMTHFSFKDTTLSLNKDSVISTR